MSATNMVGDLPLFMHLGGNPALLARSATEELNLLSSPRPVWYRAAILRMAAVIAQLAGDLYEAHTSTSGGLTLPWWELPTVQWALGLPQGNEDDQVEATINALEGLAHNLIDAVSRPHPYDERSRDELLSLTIQRLRPWINLQLTIPPPACPAPEPVATPPEPRMEHTPHSTDGHLQFFLGTGPWPNPPTPEELTQRQAAAAQSGQKVCATCGTNSVICANFCSVCGTNFPAPPTS